MTPDSTNSSSNAIADTRRTELATYVVDDIYKPWAENRRALEDKWQQNIDDFRSLGEETWKAGEAEDWRSKAQVNVARTKMMAAYALVTDLVLQGGRIPFRLDPDEQEEARAQQGGPEAVEDLENRVEAMTGVINDQLARCKADRQFLRAILSGVVYGEMWLNRYNKVFTSRRFALVDGTDANAGVTVDMGAGTPPPPTATTTTDTESTTRYEEVATEERGLALRYVSPWNMFWDMEAEDFREDGEGCLERTYITARELRKMNGEAFVLPDAVERAIKQAEERWAAGPSASVGDDTSRQSPRDTEIQKRSKTIRFLKCFVCVPREKAESFERQLKDGEMDPEAVSDGGNDDTQNGDMVWVHVCLADDEVVRYAKIDQQDIPYYRAMLEIELDANGGRSVADNVHDAYVSLRGKVRAFEDNKKLSANVETAIIPQMFEKIPEKRTPGGIYRLNNECTDVRLAMMPIITPDVGETLLRGIELDRQLLDELSQVPKISQGLSPIGMQPDTAYEVSKLAEAAGKYIGTITMNIDNGLIEPVIEDFLRWNMLQPGTPGQGAYKVQALGFSSFQDQILQTQRLLQFLQITAGDPEGRKEIKLRDIYRKIATSMHLDPDEVLKSLQDRQTESEQQGQDPALQLAIQEKTTAIEKTKAETEKTKTDSLVSIERLKLDRAKTVKDLVTPPPAPAVPGAKKATQEQETAR